MFLWSKQCRQSNRISYQYTNISKRKVGTTYIPSNFGVTNLKMMSLKVINLTCHTKITQPNCILKKSTLGQTTKQFAEIFKWSWKCSRNKFPANNVFSSDTRCQKWRDFFWMIPTNETFFWRLCRYRNSSILLFIFVA